VERRKKRKSNTEMMPSEIHKKMDNFECKLDEIIASAALKKCMSSGIKRAFLRMAYTETYDPLVEASDKQVRDFRINRMLTGK